MKITRDNKEIEIITILEDKDNATTFHHFKGNDYKIITIAKDSNTLNDIVVYLGLYDNNPIWTREYNEFFSKVDKKKYPDIKQEYRFEIEMINK